MFEFGNDASLMWFKRIKKFVDKNNRMSSALFMWDHNDNLIRVTTFYVQGQIYFIEVSYQNLKKCFLLV